MGNIVISKISKSFKGQSVLQDISFECNSGKIYGLVGHNGSGKSVLMKIICGLLHSDSGKICMNGKVIGKDVDFLPHAGVIIEQPKFISYMSGFKNLKLLADINKKIGNEEIINVMKMVALDPNSKKWVGKYSLGMRQRLAIAQAIMENPQVLILDEPMNGLDFEGVKLVRHCLLEQKRQGKIIILASHYMEDISILCDDIIRLENGRMVPYETDV